MNCQSKLIDEIGEENNWFDDKRQYIMRKFRFYRKKILVRLRPAGAPPGTLSLNHDEIKPGDIVRVLSKPEIERTLGRNGKIGGCSFLKNQYGYCGNKYKVFKKIDYFFDEKSQKMVKSNDLFLLEACYCNGISAYLKPCGRNCLYYWHKHWLAKLS
jgi:hypothetical protein